MNYDFVGIAMIDPDVTKLMHVILALFLSNLHNFLTNLGATYEEKCSIKI